MAQQAHRQVRVGAVGADMFTAEQPQKRGKGGDIGDHAGGGETGGHAHHVLFGNPDIEKTVGVALGKLDGAVAKAQIGSENADARVLIGQFGQGARRNRRMGLGAQHAQMPGFFVLHLDAGGMDVNSCH